MVEGGGIPWDVSCDWVVDRFDQRLGWSLGCPRLCGFSLSVSVPVVGGVCH